MGTRHSLTHTVHKEHPLGQGLVEKHVLHPEVQWKEETHFILSWELAHVSSSRGDHMMGSQGASPGLFPKGRVVTWLPGSPFRPRPWPH